MNVSIFFATLLMCSWSLPVMAGDLEDSVPSSEIDQMVDDVGPNENGSASYENKVPEPGAAPEIFSKRVTELDNENDSDESVVDQEMGETGEVLMDSTTPVPAGDSYNKKFGKTDKKKVAKKSAKSKKSLVKSKNKKSKKTVSSKGKKSKKDVAKAKSKSKKSVTTAKASKAKKSKDRRIASAKIPSRRR